MTPQVRRIATPARDFLEARGIRWGYWLPATIAEARYRRMGSLAERALRSHTLALQRARDWYAAHRDQMLDRRRAQKTRYQPRASATAIATSTAPMTADHKSPAARPTTATFAPHAAKPATNSHLPAQATAD